MITVGRDEYKLIPVDLEGNRRIEVNLLGENAKVDVIGLVLGRLDETKSLEVYITHSALNTKSNVNVRAVLRGRSKFDFRGNVKINHGAKGSDAYLRSDALLFDAAKMGDETPALEILEKDVKAGHAAIQVGKFAGLVEAGKAQLILQPQQLVLKHIAQALVKEQGQDVILELGRVQRPADGAGRLP